MSAPVTAAPQRRAAPQVSAFVVGAILVIVASVCLMALRLPSASNHQTAAVETSCRSAIRCTAASPARAACRHSTIIRLSIRRHLCFGYPLHGGLAGPSRVGTIAISSYGIGYPLHGGLAGPSRMSTFDRPSYPHGGFAGPSRADDDR